MAITKKDFLVVPSVLLALVFAFYGAQGFMGSEEFYAIVSVLGLSAAITHTFVF